MRPRQQPVLDPGEERLSKWLKPRYKLSCRRRKKSAGRRFDHGPVGGKKSIKDQNHRLAGICDRAEMVMFEILWMVLIYSFCWLRPKLYIAKIGSRFFATHKLSYEG
jgi:hypothetical protein